MARDVPRIGRVLDFVGLLLFLVGGALYARSWFGLRGMSDFTPGPDAPLFAAIARANTLTRLGHIGFGFMAAGAVVACVAALVAWRLGRRTRDTAA